MTAERPARQRRARSLTESLASIVLGLEAVLVFFVALTAFGLHATTPAIAFGGGAALLLVLLVATRLVRWTWGLWIGWALQAVIIATGILLTAMYVVGALFLALWIFCIIRGRQVDAQNAALAAASAPTSTPSQP